MMQRVIGRGSIENVTLNGKLLFEKLLFFCFCEIGTQRIVCDGTTIIEVASEQGTLFYKVKIIHDDIQLKFI
jgi:hypothetical protein